MGVNKFVIYDSNVWIALFNKKDSLKSRAEELIRLKTTSIIMPEYVFVEVMNTLVARGGKAQADIFLDYLESTDLVYLQHMQSADIEWLNIFFQNSPHSDLSYVDHYLLMMSQKYKLVTFDQKLAKLIKNHPKS